MTQPGPITADDLHGREVLDSEGKKVGKISGVYLDQAEGKPEWATVKTGFFGSHEALLPLATASFAEGKVTVPFTAASIKDAPHTDPDQELTQQQEAELFSYYKVPYGGDTVTATSGTTAPQSSGVQDTSGPNTDDAMTRSEERLHVGTESAAVAKARLVKHVVTENVTQSVPVSHEEVTVTREPITEANRGDALSGADLTEEEAEVTLHAERPVVFKETVPIERVKLGTETVTEQATVDETVRHEVIETEGVDRA